jgi:putative endonuclease
MLLNCTSNRKVSYVGYTSNLKKRILLHNSSKGAKFTKGRKWILIYKRKYFDKSDALKNEYKLKKNSILRKKLKDTYIKKYLA